VKVYQETKKRGVVSKKKTTLKKTGREKGQKTKKMSSDAEQKGSVKQIFGAVRGKLQEDARKRNNLRPECSSHEKEKHEASVT